MRTREEEFGLKKHVPMCPQYYITRTVSCWLCGSGAHMQVAEVTHGNGAADEGSVIEGMLHSLKGVQGNHYRMYLYLENCVTRF